MYYIYILYTFINSFWRFAELQEFGWILSRSLRGQVGFNHIFRGKGYGQEALSGVRYGPLVADLAWGKYRNLPSGYVKIATYWKWSFIVDLPI